MTFFKLTGVSSKKNKTASAANTPSQTPRTSIHMDRELPAKAVLTPENALEMLFQKGHMGHMQAMSMARMAVRL
ncbi:hypothetical protein BG003_009046 [Podila horticola]|nr:hypothetical protein BG003_009046 [Podila horticola]